MTVIRFPTSAIAPTYLVVIGEVLIAQDIALTITDHDPAATVLIATSMIDAEDAVAEAASLVVAFVASRTATFAASRLFQRIKDRGGRVVLLGNDAEATAPSPDWDVLAQPFDTAAVVKALRRDRCLV